MTIIYNNIMNIQSSHDKSDSQGTWKSVRLIRSPTYRELNIFALFVNKLQTFSKKYQILVY